METNTKRGWLTAQFADRDSAERAYNALIAKGYSHDDVNLMMSDDTRTKYFKNDDRDTDLGNKALEGAGAGSAIGGTLGAIAGAIAAIGTAVAIPGLGIVIAGPLAAALAGAGAGGATGGLIGALIGAGIPEERAKVYEQSIKDGNIVLAFRPHSDEDATHIENEWRTYNGQHIYR